MEPKHTVEYGKKGLKEEEGDFRFLQSGTRGYFRASPGDLPVQFIYLKPI